MSNDLLTHYPQNTLEYECTCTDGSTPNITDYRDTLPFYVCQQWITDCTAAHPNDLSGQAACQSVTCGTQNASQASTTSSGSSSETSSSSSSETSDSSSDDSDSSSSTDSEPSASASGDAAEASESGNAAAAIGMNYGTGILMSGLLAVFGLAL